MAQPWKILDSIPTEEGALELRQRGERDFLITIGNQILMNSLAHRSEVVLGQLGCRHLKNSPAPRVLVGGLGMGFTLKAVLDELPATASVVVAELNPVVVQWCRGPLAGLTDGAVDDPRVTVEICDVAELVRKYAIDDKVEKFDAVVFDLYRGPHAKTDRVNDPLYGSRAIGFAKAALKPAGIFTIWGEDYDEGFDKRLRQGGFSVTNERPGRGGLRHVVFLAKLAGARAKKPAHRRS